MAHGWPLLYDLGWDTDWSYWFARQGLSTPDLSQAAPVRTPSEPGRDPAPVNRGPFRRCRYGCRRKSAGLSSPPKTGNQAAPS